MVVGCIYPEEGELRTAGTTSHQPRTPVSVTGKPRYAARDMLMTLRTKPTPLPSRGLRPHPVTRGRVNPVPKSPYGKVEPGPML